MTEKEIRIELESLNSQTFLQSYDFSKNQANHSLKEFIAERLKVTNASVAGNLGELFFTSPFHFSVTTTVAGSTQCFRRLLRDSTYSREWLFQLCIHLKLEWWEARDLFEEHLGMLFTNYGNLQEIVYEYCISNQFDIDDCYRLLEDIQKEYDESSEKQDILTEEQRIQLRLTELAMRQTKYISDRYVESGIVDKSEEDFKIFIREFFRFFHSIRETALRDFKYILCTPKEIKRESLCFLMFTDTDENLAQNKNDIYLKFSDQAYSYDEVKEFNGQYYVVRYHHNCRPDIEKLASILNAVGYIKDDDIDDETDETNETKSDRELKLIERRKKENIKYRKNAIKDRLTDVLDGRRSVSRELLIVCMLLSGFNKMENINAFLNFERNGFNQLNCKNKFDAIVYESIVKTRNESSRLAAFERFCENAILCKYASNF